MELRIATASDAADLVKFNQAMALETEGKTLSAEILSPGVEAVFNDPAKGFYVVAEADTKLVGGLLITYEWSDWRNAWFWWIQSVYVEPSYRGRRVYSQLYDFAKREAADAGNTCGLRLYVEKENAHAQRVYEKLGMEETYYLMYEEKL